MDKNNILYETICTAMTEKSFLKRIDMSAEEMNFFLDGESRQRLCRNLFTSMDEKGRFTAEKTVTAINPYLRRLGNTPEEGWLKEAYGYVLGELFPEKKKLSGT